MSTIRKEDILKVKCIAYDFDGVMTDNRVLVDENGKEAVYVNRSDGYAIARFKEMGIKQVIISTEKNSVVKARANKLGVEIYYDVFDKGKILLDYCNKEGIDPFNIFYIGNDLNDESAFRVAGITGAPKDAEPEILEMADWVSERNGGYGVIRDLYRFFSKN